MDFAITDPLVSIVVPVYNVEKYLGRCMDSLLAQTLENIEIICVDDGSTDNSGLILEQYSKQDKRIKLIRQPNGGLSAARNAGLAQMRGKYLTFVDSDDWIEADTCKRVVEILEADSEIDYVCWGFKVVYENANSSSPSKKNTPKDNKVKLHGKQRIDYTVIHSKRTPLFVWNKMFKAELVSKYSISFPIRLFSEDLYFWHLYAAHADYGYYLDERFYNYNIRPGSLTSKLEQKPLHKMDARQVFKKAYEHYKVNGLLTDDSKRLLLSQTFLMMYLGDLNRIKKTQEAQELRDWASRTAIELDLVNLPNNYIKFMKMGQDHDKADYSPLEKLFSIKNRDAYKVITVFGKEFKLKRP